MYIRPVTVRKNGKRHTYWQLVRSVRTARGPRQEVVAYLGGLEEKKRRGLLAVGRAAMRNYRVPP